MDNDKGRVDVRHLIAEVAKRHGILLRPDDAVFAVVTISELVLESTAQKAMRAMTATLDRFETSIHRAENRAGQIIGEQVRESVQEVRRLVNEDIGAASIKTDQLIRRIHKAYNARALQLWASITLLCAMMCAVSFWLGRMLAR
jgi:hypothetical protein